MEVFFKRDYESDKFFFLSRVASKLEVEMKYHV